MEIGVIVTALANICALIVSMTLLIRWAYRLERKVDRNGDELLLTSERMEETRHTIKQQGEDIRKQRHCQARVSRQIGKINYHLGIKKGKEDGQGSN